MAHPFHLMKAGETMLHVQSAYFDEEHEYEKGKQVQDLFEYTHLLHEFGALFGLPGERQLGVNLQAVTNGNLYKEYAVNFHIPKEDVSYRGFHAAEVYYQEHFKTKSDKNKWALEFYFKGSPFSGKETNFNYSGKDFAMSLHYSHIHNHEWRFYGELRTKVYGRKKTRKHNGEMEVINAYSEFGNGLGLQWLKGDFWYEGAAYFYLTTDYHSSSPSYTRLTDKGFVTGGKFLIGYRVNQTTAITLEHVRSGANFNVIADVSNATEFEIETQYSQLGVRWAF